GKVRSGQEEVERNEDGNQLRCAEDCEEKALMVEPEEADAITWVHAERVQSVRHAIGNAIQLGVRPALVAEDQRRALRTERGSARQHEAGAMVVHPGILLPYAANIHCAPRRGFGAGAPPAEYVIRSSRRPRPGPNR